MKGYMTKLGRAALGVLALYLTIWPHEMGHSVAAFLFGCKADWWRTDMSVYLWSSWAGKVDYRCLETKGSTALGTVDFAGIAVNLFLLALCPILGGWYRGRAAVSGRAGWILLATVWWAWANYAEAFSYLIVNTAWLTSDMKTVVVATGIGRWVWFTAGVSAASAIGWLMWRPTKWAAAVLAAPQPARGWVPAVFPLYALVAGGAMSAARIVLT